MNKNLILIFVSLLLSTSFAYSQSYPIPSNYVVTKKVEHDFDRDGKKDLCVFSDGEDKTILLFLSRDYKKTKTFQKYEIDHPTR